MSGGFFIPVFGKFVVLCFGDFVVSFMLILILQNLNAPPSCTT